MKRTFLLPVLALVLACTAGRASAAPVTLVENGSARAAIHVPAEVMAADQAVPRTEPYAVREAETHRRRLRDSVLDLAATLKTMSGASVEIIQAPPAEDAQQLPILVGDYAREKFGDLGEPASRALFNQGFRLIVSPEGVGFIGQSGESTSYAIYELLDRLGCRWFIPGELGEVIPSRKTVQLEPVDLSDAPDTLTRGVWYAEEAFKRRNRLGGFVVSAGHALDRYIPEDVLAANPKLNAERDGERKINSGFLCWGNPETASLVADAIIARLDKNYVPSVSLSPKDGVSFCQCDEFCTPLDAGDWDPTMSTVSITDRYIVFCNRIAEKVTKKYPDVRFGFLAYVQYTRPPVRETLHPNLVPQIAPITYCRAHSALGDNCPSRPLIKPIIEGWTKASATVSYYNYMFHLAEVAVPYPMMRQMADELPILYASGTPIFWQPETMPNFDSVLPGMWLSLRMAWDTSLKPEAVFDELFAGFYGDSGPAMRRYWETFDDAWISVPAHAGSGWSYMRRFTPEVMAEARQAMDEAIAAADSAMEYRRVKLFDDSLRQFERFMNLRQDLGTGRTRAIAARATGWFGTQIGLGQEYAENSAFLAASWSGVGNIAAGYFRSFFDRTYQDLGRIDAARNLVLLNRKPGPVRLWRYQFLDRDGGSESESNIDTIALGEERGFHTADLDDSDWPTTDTMVERWADMGLLGKFGTMWYRAKVAVPAIPEGKRIYLWISATDGRAKVFVNGQHVPYTKADGSTAEYADGYCVPFSFDVTEAVKPGGENSIVIAGNRAFLNELGTGGLLGPVYLYHEK